MYAVTGKRTEALAVIRALEDKYARKEANALDLAAIYGALGERDRAFEWLERDFQNRIGNLGTIRWRIPYEPLRDDPRIKDLLKRMSLPD